MALFHSSLLGLDFERGGVLLGLEKKTVRAQCPATRLSFPQDNPVHSGPGNLTQGMICPTVSLPQKDVWALSLQSSAIGLRLHWGAVRVQSNPTLPVKHVDFEMKFIFHFLKF